MISGFTDARNPSISTDSTKDLNSSLLMFTRGVMLMLEDVKESSEELDRLNSPPAYASRWTLPLAKKAAGFPHTARVASGKLTKFCCRWDLADHTIYLLTEEP
ncbi:hypothetical protein LXL04_026950 [Taraxacum kok-saghyz]